MKKIAILAGLAVMGMNALAACSGGQTQGENAEPASTLSETNVGVDAQTDSDSQAAIAAEKTQKQDVTELADDKAYRPGMKVDRLTILDFNATWCGPCKQFSPVFHEAAKKFGKRVNFVSIDTDRNPETADAFNIQSIPTVVFIYPNGKTKRFVGTGDLMPQSKFNALIQGEM